MTPERKPGRLVKAVALKATPEEVWEAAAHLERWAALARAAEAG
jgi:hypothetical protein